MRITYAVFLVCFFNLILGCSNPWHPYPYFNPKVTSEPSKKEPPVYEEPRIKEKSAYSGMLDSEETDNETAVPALPEEQIRQTRSKEEIIKDLSDLGKSLEEKDNKDIEPDNSPSEPNNSGRNN